MIKFNKFSGMKDFLILWIGQSISTLGTAMTNFALIIWVYQQQGTATSITMLSICSYLPSILFSFVAGAITDKWDKKNIMLLSDSVSAIGTLSVFVLFSTGSLQIWHLYIINFTLSFMSAFQNPASYVAESLLIPKEHYARASGLQAFSNSIISIATPAIGAAVLAFGGLRVILAIDLIAFAIAFITLLFFIKIPVVPDDSKRKSSFIKSCLEGINFLKEHKVLLQLIIFFSFINLLSYMTGFGIMPAMILSRSGNNQATWGMVSSFIGIGTLVGSLVVTMIKPAKSRTNVIFISLAVSFLLADALCAVGRNPLVWIIAAFAGNLPLPFISANMTTIMRTNIPLKMQGRVFAARDTIQFCTRPIGLFLGGIFADYLFEPLMQSDSPFKHLISIAVGTGKGSGMAFMFLITGTVGCIASLLVLKSQKFKELDS